MSFLNFAEPVTFVRSPTFTKRISSVMVKGSRPESRSRLSISGIGRGLFCAAAAEIAEIWSGVVPQQPPKIFTKPNSANSPTISAISSAS